MRLLKCYVDNFGKLSNYEYSFTDGLNVIQEANGFGKSTLAAFIKAMFYGFPRIGKRNVQENERKKYLPWQGGTYGGSLDFEFEGKQYRVRRTFGKAAAKDTFSLRDLDNREESSRFSEELGQKLFQLDAESFVRSVFMPQILETDTFATTSIQTKLNNLVDNTDDLNNYDSAVARLQGVRLTFRKQRGSGGKIDEIQEDIYDLESKLAEAETQREPLHAVTKEVEELKREKGQREEQLAALRSKIFRASTQQAAQALQSQFASLEKELHETEASIQALSETYPNGYPTRDEIVSQNKNVLLLQQSMNGLSELMMDEETSRLAELGREIFADEDQTAEDIRTCREACSQLSTVNARAEVQMNQEEMTQREELRKFFSQGVPDEQEFLAYQKKVDALSAKGGEWNAHQLTEEEEGDLSKLEFFFDGKSVDEQELEQCEEAASQIQGWEVKVQECQLSEADQKEWNRLSHVFSIELPTEDEIQQKQNDCRRIAELNTKKETKTTVLQSVSQEEKPVANRSKMLLVGGGILLVVGVICFVLAKIAAGAVLAVVGFSALLCAFWLRTKQMISQSAGTVAVESSAISEEEIQELYVLQRSMTEFLSKFYTDVADPAVKLTDLRLDRQDYLKMKEKKRSLEQENEDLCTKIENKRLFLQEVCLRFYPGQLYRADFVGTVRDSWHRYRELQNRQSKLQAQRDKLTTEMNELKNDLEAFFTRYYPDGTDMAFSVRLSRLKTDVQTLTALDQRWNSTKENRETSQENARKLIEFIETILKRYHTDFGNGSYAEALERLNNDFASFQSAVKAAEDFKNEKTKWENQKKDAERKLNQFAEQYNFLLPLGEEELSKILNDIESYNAKLEQKEKADKKLDDFKNQHPEYRNGLTEAQAEPIDNDELERLQWDEKEKNNKLDACKKELEEKQRARKNLLEKVERIPELEDQLKQRKEECDAAEKSYEILDTTLTLLEKAKNNLSNRYIGSVERSFTAYIKDLIGEDFRNTLVDRNLTIRIDESGEARELNYYSVGTIDSILLCMRLALIDALFEEEKPFLLLDDPFVNLDDDHTKRALEILNKIAENRQIVYMVCNSSRR